MARGLSIHVGLNSVDAARYDGWGGALSGCENDARSMADIARAGGFASTILLTTQATSDAVIDAIGRASRELKQGDYLLLTYSGHGGQVDDVNGDEDDRKDETWVLYDRMLVDDELYALWSRFANGVRIFVLSDSCHSGTVTREAYMPLHAVTVQQYAGLPAAAPRTKQIPSAISRAIEMRDAAQYRTVQWISGDSHRQSIGASVILISGCQDNQLSQDGDVNGLFTQSLLEVWNRGAFTGSYRAFCREIVKRMPISQTPNYLQIGAPDAAFESSKPFAV